MARVEPVRSGGLKTDSLHVAHRCAAGLDVHKMQITASVRLAQPRGDPLTDTEEFSTLPKGLRGLTHWLLSHGVSAAAKEGTGIYWNAPFEALEDAGIEPIFYHARFVKFCTVKRTPCP